METNINANANIGTSLETNHTLDFSDRVYKVVIAFIVVLGMASAGWVFAQFAGLPQNMPREIQVSGEGKAYIKPDIALVTFGVTAQAPKSQDAVTQSNTKMNAIIAAIKSLGVEDKDIQTTGYNLSPVYGYERGGVVPMGLGGGGGTVSSPMYYPIPQNQVVTGYSLDQRLSIKIRNFDSINTILDKATAAGATDVGGLQFTLDNPEQARSEARAKAIENAKEKLKTLASQSGLRVGRLVNVYEGYNNYPQPMYSSLSKDAVGMGGGPAPEIQPGQQEVTVSINLSYEVK